MQLAKIDPDWSSSHREMVAEIEDELGREICGVPEKIGSPCKNWPVDKSHGRCSKHAPDSEAVQSEESAVPVEVTDTDEDVSGGIDMAKIYNSLFKPYVLFGLILGGILIGIFLSGLLLYYSYNENLFSHHVISSDESSSFSEKTAGPGVEFEQINRFFQNEEYEKLERKLKQAAENGNPEERSKALYYLFVFNQRIGRYRKALQVGKDFVDEFPDHSRAPEVLYSKIEISRQQLEEPGLTEEYLNRIKKEYPDSKWTEKVISRD